MITAAAAAPATVFGSSSGSWASPLHGFSFIRPRTAQTRRIGAFALDYELRVQYRLCDYEYWNSRIQSSVARRKVALAEPANPD